MEEVYVALVMGLLFFLCKIVLNKIQKVESTQREFRDSLLVTLLTGGVLWVKKTQFSGVSSKAHVFVNEPGF